LNDVGQFPSDNGQKVASALAPPTQRRRFSETVFDLHSRP